MTSSTLQTNRTLDTNPVKPKHLRVQVDEQDQVDPKQWYTRLGKFIALVFGIGTGVTASAALATVFSGPLFIVMATILCTGSVYANYRMTHNDVTDILFGGIKGLFKKQKPVHVAEADWNEYMSTPRKIALSVGILLSLTFGLAFMGLVFKASLDLILTYSFLASVSFLLPAVGVILGTTTFICLGAIMVGGFSSILKIEDFRKKAKAILTEIFWYVPGRDSFKSLPRIIAERLLVGLAVTAVVALTLGLVFYGKINTLQNCARGLHEILLHVPHLTANGAALASVIIGQGLALFAQIPFAFKLVLAPITILFAPKDPAAEVTATTKPSAGIQWSTVTLFIASTLSALAQAAIAIQGKAMNEITALAGLGSFMDGFVATTVNALLGDKDSKKSGAEPTPNRSSTVEITNSLSGAASGRDFQAPGDQPYVSPPLFQQREVKQEASAAPANEEEFVREGQQRFGWHA